MPTSRDLGAKHFSALFRFQPRPKKIPDYLPPPRITPGRVPLRLATRLRYLYLAYFSKPVSERVLYRALRRTGGRKILEIGIGNTARTLRMIHLTQRLAGDETVRYAAIDLFEARPSTDAESLSLKEVHRLLKPTPAQVQLIPGDPAQALARAANSLPNVDVVLICKEHTDAALAGAWFYVPRMLHATSVVFREVPDAATGATTLAVVEPAEIQARAATGRRRAA
jgi:hypothetical protein